MRIGDVVVEVVVSVPVAVAVVVVAVVVDNKIVGETSSTSVTVIGGGDLGVVGW